MQIRNKLLTTLPIAGALALAGCGGSSESTSQEVGTLRVAMTDAPACGFDAVHVTVTRIRVHRSETAADEDGGWRDLTVSPPRKLNLLDLQNGVLADLGQIELEAGRYMQVRLVLDAAAGSNTVTPTGGTELALRTPSAQQSGLKLKHVFDVAADQTVDLVLDFDACRSIVKAGNTGNYLLKPVLTAIPVVTSGTIAGSLGAAGSGAVVSVQGVDDAGLPVVVKEHHSRRQRLLQARTGEGCIDELSACHPANGRRNAGRVRGTSHGGGNHHDPFDRADAIGDAHGERSSDSRAAGAGRGASAADRC